MSLVEFDRAIRNQYVAGEDGWYESCTTLDGRFRPTRSVRVCSDFAFEMGASVQRGGCDFRMGGDARRWPQSLLGHHAVGELSRRSASARMELANSADKTVTHIRLSADGRSVRTYQALAPHALARWRVDEGGEHVIVQLLNTQGQAERYATLPLDAASSSSDWKEAPQFLGPGQTVRLDANHVSRWCEHLGTYPLVSSPKGWATLSSIRSSKVANDMVFADLMDRKGVVCWRQHGVDAACLTPERVRGAILRMLRPMPSASTGWEADAEVALSRDASHRGIVIHVSTPSASATIRVGPFTRKGLGFLYETDDAIKTGLPMCHTETRTVNLDECSQVCGRHTNCAHRACFVSGDGRSLPRPTLLAILRGLVAVDHTCDLLVAEACNPVWRAQLAAVLKLMPVYDGAVAPELRRCVDVGSRIALTPDETHVRIQGGDTTVRVLYRSACFACAAFAGPHHFDASLFRTLQAAPPGAKVDITMRRRGACFVASSDSAWMAHTVILYGRRKCYNRRAPLPVFVDRFVENTSPDVSILVETPSGNIGIVDFASCADPRALLLPSTPVYRVTSFTAGNGQLMIRPFPTPSELKSMLAHARSYSDEDALFSYEDRSI